VLSIFEHGKEQDTRIIGRSTVLTNWATIQLNPFQTVLCQYNLICCAALKYKSPIKML
jgi:hypothetical protein